MKEEREGMKLDLERVLELMNDTCNLMARKIQVQEREIERLRNLKRSPSRGARKKYRDN